MRRKALVAVALAIVWALSCALAQTAENYGQRQAEIFNPEEWEVVNEAPPPKGREVKLVLPEGWEVVDEAPVAEHGPRDDYKKQGVALSASERQTKEGKGQKLFAEILVIVIVLLASVWAIRTLWKELSQPVTKTIIKILKKKWITKRRILILTFFFGSRFDFVPSDAQSRCF